MPANKPRGDQTEARKRRFCFTDAAIGKLKVPAGLKIKEGKHTGEPVRALDWYDTDEPGLSLRVNDRGVKVWRLSLRVRNLAEGGAGSRCHEVLGNYPAVSLKEARRLAAEAREQARDGINWVKVKVEAAKAEKRAQEKDQRLLWEIIAKDYVDRRLTKEKQNRTAHESERIFRVYITPTWKGRLITEITRRDVNALIDRVHDRKLVSPSGKVLGGPVQADHVLVQIRALMDWYATRDDEFTSPIVKGMARTSQKDRARDRVLSDEEIAILWAVAGDDTFGAVVKTLLLTAQRRSEVACMRYDEVDEHGLWIIPAERYKTKRANIVPLSGKAHEIVMAQPRLTIDGTPCPYVFSLSGLNPFGDYVQTKRALDKRMLTELKTRAAARGDDPEKVTLLRWTLHDLRRTARSLMSRVGVRPDVGEMCLGHVIHGVQGIYDRHSYTQEKASAFEALAAEVARITSPDGATGKVVPFQRG